MGMTPNHSSVAASTSSVTILAGNARRRGATIQNTSTGVLYLRFGGSAATATTGHSVRLGSNERYDLPAFDAGNARDAVYTGQITGIWSNTDGQANVSEWED